MRRRLQCTLLVLAGCATEEIALDAQALPGPVDFGRAFDALRFDGAPARPDARPPADAGLTRDAIAAVDQAPLPEDLAPPGEACDGLDDDGDGLVDEAGACGPYLQTHCRLYLGVAEGGSYFAPQPTWGACPAEDRERDDPAQRCSGTRGDGAFARLNLPADLDDGDWLAVSLRCADEGNPTLAAYFQSHCKLFLGWDSAGRVVDGAPAWGACPESASSSSGAVRCVSTAGDGQFWALPFDRDVGEGQALGLAWRCDDPADPARAAALTESAAVYLGWADERLGPLDGSPSWGPCPAEDGGELAGQRCVGTRGDGAFRRLVLSGDVNDDDNLGVALRARRP